jgi:hypothetical protein
MLPSEFLGLGVGVHLAWECEDYSGAWSCAGPFDGVIVTMVDVTRERRERWALLRTIGMLPLAPKIVNRR